jgi:hypothetical protein
MVCNFGQERAGEAGQRPFLSALRTQVRHHARLEKGKKTGVGASRAHQAIGSPESRTVVGS